MINFFLPLFLILLLYNISHTWDCFQTFIILSSEKIFFIKFFNGLLNNIYPRRKQYLQCFLLSSFPWLQCFCQLNSLLIFKQGSLVTPYVACSVLWPEIPFFFSSYSHLLHVKLCLPPTIPPTLLLFLNLPIKINMQLICISINVFLV